MLPVLFRIGPVAVYSYPVVLLLAFLSGSALARWYLRRSGVPVSMATDLALAAAVGGIVGARGLHVAGHWTEYARHPLWILMLQRGGMVFYGGLIGGAAAVAALAISRRLPGARIADAAALAVPLGSAVGRVGCFLNGCCAGRPTNGPLGVSFPDSTAHVLPTQLIDAAANGLILAVLLHVAVRMRPRDGMLWWIFLMLYAVTRFSVELLRVNPQLALGMTEAQWISMALLGAGSVGLGALYRRPSE